MCRMHSEKDRSQQGRIGGSPRWRCWRQRRDVRHLQARRDQRRQDGLHKGSPGRVDVSVRSDRKRHGGDPQGRLPGRPSQLHWAMQGEQHRHPAGWQPAGIKRPGQVHGVHVGGSSKISILNSTIGTGDDCVSIGPGCNGVLVDSITCGPGQGISVGCLGRYKDEKDVSDITRHVVHARGHQPALLGDAAMQRRLPHRCQRGVRRQEQQNHGRLQQRQGHRQGKHRGTGLPGLMMTFLLHACMVSHP
ncbi:Pectin lyase-like superfamily protein [Zea mays]|uniref:Pectin lyase-like superfamily protein n=1 Tax=Zea mays TaxID=4577 RepID=A0A1D6FIY7_MAIZE|nr:Pectin lyase-like superfamily protein [Zea mays]